MIAHSKPQATRTVNLRLPAELYDLLEQNKDAASLQAMQAGERPYTMTGYLVHLLAKGLQDVAQSPPAAETEERRAFRRL